MKRPRIPVSSYAQLKARRTYHARNRAALNLMRKMLRAGVRISTDEARRMVGQCPGTSSYTGIVPGLT